MISITERLRIALPEGLTIGSEDAPVRATATASNRRPGTIPLSELGLGGVIRGGEAERVAAALEAQDLELVHSTTLTPSQDHRGAPAAGPLQLSVEVDVQANENAVVLLEQGGFYAWNFESAPLAQPIAETECPRGQRNGLRTATVVVRLRETAAANVERGGWDGLLIGGVRAFVFKYAGRYLLERGAAFLERKVQTHFLEMNSENPDEWGTLQSLAELKLPENRRARILLFVHGTFSSTKGGFAGLCATPWGRAFLEAARANYDAIIGFDHATLTVDPLLNATLLLRGFESRDWRQPALIDAISHSRGGIVLRTFMGELLPATKLPLRIERAIFVGVVNGGTEFAEPRNWRTLVNLYTNVAAAACRAIAMFPQTAFAATLVREVIQGLGTLVKVLASTAIDDAVLPGLAAMQPTGVFIRELNAFRPTRATQPWLRLYVITSEFSADLAVESSTELPPRLLKALAGGVVNQLMRQANDLVVNTSSMTMLGEQEAALLRGSLEFGRNGIVYHTNYFLQPQTVKALTRWLELQAPEAATPARNRGVVPTGTVFPAIIPAAVETNFIYLDASATREEVLKEIQACRPAYVIAERLHHGETLRYGLRVEEVLEALRGRGNETLEGALSLREEDASGSADVRDPAWPARRFGRSTKERVVVVENGRILGIAEPSTEPQRLENLVSQANGLLFGGATGALAAQRAMPHFGPVLAQSAGTRGGVLAPVLRGASGAVEKELLLPAFPDGTAPQNEGRKNVACHLLAEMEDRVGLMQPAEVAVTLSREEIEVRSESFARTSLPAAPDSAFTLQLILKANFAALPETTLERQVNAPAPGRPETHFFDLQATHAGDGEVLVRVLRESQLLATLGLKCRIEEKRERRGRARAEASVLAASPSLRPPHQLAIFEIKRGDEILYQYILDSEPLNLKHCFESRPLRQDRRAYIARVYEDLNTAYVSTTSDSAEFWEKLRSIGAELWDELIPEPLQKILWEKRASIDGIVVFSEEPFIPWELVHFKPPGTGLPEEEAFFAQRGLLRWLHNAGWPPTELRASTGGRCCYVVPKYPGTLVLNATEQEAAYVKRRFEARCVEPTMMAIKQLLQSPEKFDLLHFAGHGMAEGGQIERAELLLEGRIEGDQYVTKALPVRVVEQGPNLVCPDGTRPIVTLNACDVGRAGHKLTAIGGFARAFLTHGAGVFCGPMWPVGDTAALMFVQTLYDALCDGGADLAQATIKARMAVRTQDRRIGRATWLAYTVYGNPRAKLNPSPVQ